MPFIRASLKLAQTMAKGPQNAEIAVGHLRVATVLVRLLNTWEGDVGEHRIDRLFR